MSVLGIFNKAKLENGIVWSGFFGMATIPIYFCTDKWLFPTLKLEKTTKKLISQETFKLLLSISTFIGFIYGYNTQRRLTH